MRVVIADDEMLMREGTSRLLQDAGVEVVAAVDDASKLLREIATQRPDVAIVDIKMPPTHTDEGLVAAEEIGRSFPEVAVLVLSQYLESVYAMRLLESHPEGRGYLLKERVSDIAVVEDALRRLTEGECVLDPSIVARLVGRRRAHSPIDDLTERERAVLTFVAEGRSNRGVAEALFLSQKTVEAHVGRIFTKLGLEDAPDSHRRVLAVLAFLRA